jgi:hypothetical protein
MALFNERLGATAGVEGYPNQRERARSRMRC